MTWILVQPADGEESMNAMIHLNKTGEYSFDIIKNDTQFESISFGSRS